VTGAVNDSTVRVGPGYAIDEAGRELVLAETLEVAVPESSGGAMFVLVMTYQADAQFLPRPDVDTVCLGSGLNPRSERPILTWRAPDDVRFGPDVPLAAALVNKGALIAAPGLQVRRYAARHIRPHIGFATVEPVFESATGGVTTTIDTSEAGFTATPCYFAKLDVALTSNLGVFLAAATAFAFISGAEPTRFAYNIPLRLNVGLERFASLRQAREAPPKLSLSWLGLEPVSGCEPHVNPLFIFTLAGLHLNFTAKAATFATSIVGGVRP